MVASTQFNSLTRKAFLLCLTFVKLVSANLFGTLSSELFMLCFVFLIFKSKYFALRNTSPLAVTVLVVLLI